VILLIFLVCASALAADPGRAGETGAMNASGSRPNVAKSKRTFHPLRLFRRLGKAESEFGLRLSSWGIQREVEGGSNALQRPSPLTEASTSMPQGLGGASN
jgi:hypothetical protein